MNYDDCPICGTKMTGFMTLFCPKEDEHGSLTDYITRELEWSIRQGKPRVVLALQGEKRRPSHYHGAVSMPELAKKIADDR